MKNLSDYLKKFKLILSDKTDEIRILQSVFRDSIGVEIPNSQISIRSGVVYVTASPIIKNKIYLAKENVLSCVKEQGLQSITEIR